VDLKVNDNIIIPVPRVDRGPIDCRNIRGIIVNKTVNGYKIGTTVGVINFLRFKSNLIRLNEFFKHVLSRNTYLIETLNVS
jgi:hypothetical protein